MNPGPISPDEVAEAKISVIPDEVFKVFNDLIARHWNGTEARVLQREVVDALVNHPSDRFTRKVIFDDHLLDVEPVYRHVGWKVIYDKPGYNETYEPVFLFQKRKKTD